MVLPAEVEATWFSGKVLVRLDGIDDDLHFFFLDGQLRLIEPTRRKKR